MRRFGLALTLVGAVACNSTATVTGTPANGSGGGDVAVRPAIASFTASPASITAGASSTLSWTVSNAAALSMDGGVGDVTGRSSVAVTPSVTTTYTLTATGAGGTTTATAQVTVTPAATPPLISAFAASPASITAGASSTLSWTVSNATTLSIDGGVGDVTGRTSVVVTPSVTTTYRLTATGAGGTTTATAQVTVTPAATPPLISAFAASPTSITSGGTSTLTWTVSGATALSIDGGVGDVTGRSWVVVTPSATTAYTLSATNAGGTTTAAATVTVTPPSAPDATVTIDTARDRKAISPYVYGYNAATVSEAAPGATYLRIGGNRWTAYNWTSNYSNAGADWGPYSNDTYMGSPADGPGHAATPTIDDAKVNGVAALVTIPIQGWVSKDASGNVPLASALTDHFVPNKARKGSAFTTSPSSSSAEVYQDEFASFVAQRSGAGRELHLSLDNEPDLWGWVSNGSGNATHPEVQRTRLGYADFVAKWIESSNAIRDAVPGALLYGPASYGWQGYVSFQDAPDKPANASIDNSFIDHFLSRMSAAATSGGRRLLDVLDVHFYSSAVATGCSNAADDGVIVQAGDFDKGAAGWVKRAYDCVVSARLQAPRSLFDPSYVESSWITQWSTPSSSLGAGIQLIPRLRAKIAASYPGTKLAITEYNHGGADHVSGALAQADSLGIFGREGVYAAAYWPITSDTTWIKAAFRAFRNYDGAGKSFGDTSVSAASTDRDHLGVYASVDAASDGRLVLVIVHRPTLVNGNLDLRSRKVAIQWTHSRALGTARAWQLTSSSTTPAAIAAPAPTGAAVTLTVPPMSVTTLELTP